MREKGKAAVCPECGWREGTPPTSPVQIPPRTVLVEKYVLGRVLGQGGFGITYLAWDLLLNRKLAIKEYFPQEICSRSRDERTVQPLSQRALEDFQYGLSKFVEEGQNLARFRDYPGIVSLLEFFEANGTAYIVMAYMEGMTFKQYLEDHGGKIGFDAARAILEPVMDALREVHRVGMLHRDISPDNIYLNTDHQVKILDFGSTRYAMKEQSHGLTVIFKPGYAPLEQYATHGKQGPWTDVYAVGATFYRALTGKAPSGAPDRSEHDDLIPPSRLGVAILPSSEAALLKALAVRVEARFKTIKDFQDAVGPEPPPPPELERLRRNNLVLMIAACILLVTTVAFASLWRSSDNKVKAAGRTYETSDSREKSARFAAELAAVKTELEDTKQKMQAGSPALASVTDQLNESKRKLNDTTTERNNLQNRVQQLTASITTAQQERDAFKNDADAAKKQAAALRGQLEARHIKVVYFELFAWSRQTNARRGPLSQFQRRQTEYVLCGLGGPNPQQGSQALSGAIQVIFIGPKDLAMYTVTLPVTAARNAATWATQAVWGSDQPGTFEPGNWRIEVWSEGQKIATKPFHVT
jgi:serine/threonine protein kinase